eukprot:scaffold2005_cov115-Skeletonema_dohrnii-CCMP3373.AAC.10
MALPKASNVKDDVEKEQTNETVTMAINNTDDNGGGGSGEAVNYEEMEYVIMAEDVMKDYCSGSFRESIRSLSTRLADEEHVDDNRVTHKA